MAKNKYSKLMIKIDDVRSLIKIWCEFNIVEEYSIDEKDIKERIQFFVNCDNNKIQLDLIKCAGGLYTISYKVGTDQASSEKIAEYILKNINNPLKDTPYANGFSIILEEKSFNTVVDILKDDGNSLDNYSSNHTPGQASYELYKFTGKCKDIVTLKYYPSTKRLQVQGKPLYLFNDVVSLICEAGVPVDTVVDTQIEMCKVGVSKDDIYDEMKEAIGDDVYRFLPATHKAILAFPFIQFKMNIDFPDYSGLVYQAYRVFEGFTRKIFTQNGLECIGKTKIGDFFRNDEETGKFVMISSCSSKLEDEKVKILTEMYEFYHRYRHPYGHASGDDFQTAIITKRDEAYNKFTEVLNNIKKGYLAI